MMLTDRKIRILRAIIEDYVATAEPVGSRTIARKFRLGVSPATIRNEMADLEEMGYLEQPHTSAGRIPSDLGYRFYVDSLMETERITREEAMRIQQIYERKALEIDSLIYLTARVLSEATNYTSLVVGPELANVNISSFKIVPLNDGRALLIMVTDSGFVENRIIDLPEGVGETEVDKFCKILNANLRGVPLYNAWKKLLQDIHRELSRYREILEATLTVLKQLLMYSDEGRVYLGGTTNILSQPEFRDVEKVKMVLGALERVEVVQDLLRETDDSSHIRVTIGEENKYKEIRECSLITATYYLGSRKLGRIGVLGPKRMEYAKVIAVVDFITNNLSEILSKHFG